MSKSPDITELLEKYQKQLEQYRKEHERLKLLFNITRNISRELVLDNLLMLIMDEVKNILNCDRCTVFVYDEQTDELWSRVAHGENEIRFSSKLGIAGSVFHSGQVLNIPDTYADSRFNPNIDKKTGYRTRNILAVPMRNKLGETLGVFQALNKFSGPFSKDDEELFDTISIISATQIENAQLYEEQKKTFDSFVETLASTIDARDPLTAGHSQRIALYADEVAKILKLSDKERNVLRTAALLHDYGKIAVRESVLKKDGKLSDEEYDHIKEHSHFTKVILEKINFTRQLKDVPSIASSHHEKIDGSGYPSGLRSEEIPRLGKILAIVDVFDALTSRRHYRDRMDFRKVMQVIANGSDSQFDEFYVVAFKQIRLDRLVLILENENLDKINNDHLEPLKAFDMQSFLAMENKEDLDENQHHARELFYSFYSRDYLNGETS